MRARVDGRTPHVGTRLDDGGTGTHRVDSLTADDGPVPDPHSRHVGDGVVGSDGQVADDRPQLPRTWPGHEPLALP